MHRKLPPATILLPLLLVLLPSQPVQGQDGTWETEGELGGAVFFGNTNQTTFTTRISTERADSAWELGVNGGFNYGESTDDDGRDFVNKRSWKVGSSYNHRPFERWSHFVTGELESSFERRIEQRYNLGVGGKFNLVRSEATRVDLSAALLAEHTNPADRDGARVDGELLARWSGRLRARRAFGEEERVTLSTENHYRPTLGELGDFTFSSTSSLALRLTEVVSMKVTLVDNYDSGAEDRGARTNHDGQLFFSLLSSF